MTYSPVIIIGAPRSGTNMLRDMLVQLPGVGTWSCDEINYIWRHGNIHYPSDEFTPEMATRKVKKYIQGQFQRISLEKNIDTVVEKTCANSLRVRFVNEVIPDAKYIFIYRDGFDAIGSATKRWKAPLDIPYIMKKARYIPLTDLPFYATRYLLNRIHRHFSTERRLSSWGPMLHNNRISSQHSLPEICALQWKACIENSQRDFLTLPSITILKVQYETLVRTPVSEFTRIAMFLGKTVPVTLNEYMQQKIRTDSIGKGRESLGNDHIDTVTPIISSTQKQLGYA